MTFLHVCCDYIEWWREGGALMANLSTGTCGQVGHSAELVTLPLPAVDEFIARGPTR
jgi:hypothetical protein